MDAPPECGDALVVPVLVTQVRVAAGLVCRRGRDLDVRGEGAAAVGRPRVEDVGAQSGRIVPSVVPTDVDRAIGWVDRKPLVEVVGETGVVIDAQRRAPAGPLMT